MSEFSRALGADPTTGAIPQKTLDWIDQNLPDSGTSVTVNGVEPDESGNIVLGAADVTGLQSAFDHHEGRIAELESDLSLLALRLDVMERGGTIWRQDTPPPAGTLHRWTGTPHASTSQKVTDGSVVATNLVTNPRRSTSGWATFHCDLSYDPTQDMLRIAPGGTQSTNPYTTRSVDAAPEYTTAFMQVWPSDDQPVEISTYRLSAPGAQSTVVDPGGTVRSVQTGTNATFVWVTRGMEGRSALFLPMVVAGEYLGDYFDGDTPDDRENDLWFHTGENDAPYVWDAAAHDWTAWL